MNDEKENHEVKTCDNCQRTLDLGVDVLVVEEFYSVGIDDNLSLKENIADVHGEDSRQVSFVGELEEFLGDSDKYDSAAQKFKSYVRSHINTPQNTDYMLDEFVNSGYIKALEKMRAPNSENTLDFYNDYAASQGISVPQAMLFGPNGTAKQALSYWLIEEALKGQHRSNKKPENEKMANLYDKAFFNTYRLPETTNKQGEYKQIDIAEDKNSLPEGLEGPIAEAFGRERQLYLGSWYKGTRRLSGDLSYKILEAMTTELIANHNTGRAGKLNISSSRLEKIIKQANETGQEPFLALYKHLGKKDALKVVWDQARKTLNDYAVPLWRKRDNYGQEIAERAKKDLPGTIYLNNGRYYWIPKKGEKAVPLIPQKEKNKLPGSLYKNDPGGYFWWMPGRKFRRRMVPEGQKKATKDLKTAKELQCQEWEKIQIYEPKLAETLKGIRKWGTATKHKPTAVKIAKKLWKQIQENEPQTAIRIMSDKRPELSKPDMDTVWPKWTEQKYRLAFMENKPQLPIVYPAQRIDDEWKTGLRVPERLEAMVNKIKDIDWMASDAMLVFDDNSPSAIKRISTQSKGLDWTEKQYLENKRPVIQGCTSIDKDTGRFKFTVYNPGYGSEKTLAEEIYHIIYEIIRESNPETFKSIEAWHKDNLNNGNDPTLPISEAFSQSMAKEELGFSSNLPEGVVKHARKLFSDKNDIEPCIIEKVKRRLSG